jgi:hypothetical protein
MKKAEIYAKEVGVINNNDELGKRELLLLIREIQENAIKETVEECANSAKLTYARYWEGIERGYEMQARVDKSSILEVADKLIKEL